jgi:hypothetical protein
MNNIALFCQDCTRTRHHTLITNINASLSQGEAFSAFASTPPSFDFALFVFADFPKAFADLAFEEELPVHVLKSTNFLCDHK